MRKDYVNKFIPWIILGIFFIVGILYQFSVIAMHYIFGVVSYVILILAFLISIIESIKFHYKRFISFIISIVTLMLVLVFHLIICNNPFTYNVKRIDNGVEITGYTYNISNDYGDYHIEIPSQLRGYAVKSIGQNAFYGSNHIDDLVIPEGVEVISAQAFAYVKAKSVTLPDSIKKIEALAFTERNHKIEYVIIPSGIEYIGREAFAGCAQVLIVTNDSTYNDWDKNWIYGDDAVYFKPVDLKKINNVLYILCSDNTAIAALIDKKVNKVEILEKIKYDNQDYVVTTIGSYAGFNCEFKEIIIPKTMMFIKSRAFSDCKDLVNIYIPNSVQYMGEYIFMNCSLNLIINVEHEKKPDGWWENWETNKTVNWNVK